MRIVRCVGVLMVGLWFTGGTISGGVAQEKNDIPAHAKVILEKATQWELYAINPEFINPDDPDQKKPDNLFYGWEVLKTRKIK